MCYEWLGEVGLERKKGHLHCFKLIAKLHLHILLHLCKAKSWEFHKYVEAGKICWDNLKFSHCNCSLPFPSCRCTPLASFHCSLQPYTWGQTHLKSSEIKNCQLLEQGVWRIIYFLVLPCLHSLLRCLASSGPMGVCLLSMFDPSMPWALHLKTQPFNLKPFLASQLGFCWKNSSKQDQYLMFHCRSIALQVQSFRDISRPILQNLRSISDLTWSRSF